MSNISQDKLLDLVESRYALVVLAAKRARQIREHSGKLLDTDSTNPLTVALEEITAGKVGFSVPDTDEPVATALEEPELLGLPEVPEAEDILPIPEEESEEEGETALPEIEAEETLPAVETEEPSETVAKEEEAPLAEAEVPAEMKTPESTATEQASQPED